MTALDLLGIFGFVACAVGFVLGILVVSRKENRR